MTLTGSEDRGKMVKADTLDLGDLAQRTETDIQKDGQQMHEESREGGTEPACSNRKGGSSLSSSPPHQNLGFSYNRDADLIKKKRTSLHHSESEPTSDSSSPPVNHIDTTPKPVNTHTVLAHMLSLIIV